jgi:hypothetical protein
MLCLNRAIRAVMQSKAWGTQAKNSLERQELVRLASAGVLALELHHCIPVRPGKRLERLNQRA